MRGSLVRIILLLVVIIIGYKGFSQVDSANAPYLISKRIPTFTIWKSPDSTRFATNDLKKNTNTVFIIFSPECEFCQHETRDLIKNISKFKHTQIVMVSFMSLSAINDFYKKYKIAEYPNITMGKDVSRILIKHFRLRTAPSTFIYDRQGNFKIAFHRIIDMNSVLKEIN